MTLMVTNFKVFTCRYWHKHGTDVGVYDSMEAAYAGAYACIRDAWDDFGIEEMVPESLKGRPDQEKIEWAYDNWESLSGDSEYFEIEEKNVMSLGIPDE